MCSSGYRNKIDAPITVVGFAEIACIAMKSIVHIHFYTKTLYFLIQRPH
jgi:hypothetical protein